MNCDKCDFYCYEDEYICPNCEAFLKREYPADEYEKSTFIHNKIIEFKGWQGDVLFATIVTKSGKTLVRQEGACFK